MAANDPKRYDSLCDSDRIFAGNIVYGKILFRRHGVIPSRDEWGTAHDWSEVIEGLEADSARLVTNSENEALRQVAAAFCSSSLCGDQDEGPMPASTDTRGRDWVSYGRLLPAEEPIIFTEGYSDDEDYVIRYWDNDRRANRSRAPTSIWKISQGAWRQVNCYVTCDGTYISAMLSRCIKWDGKTRGVEARLMFSKFERDNTVYLRIESFRLKEWIFSKLRPSTPAPETPKNRCIVL